MFSYIIVGRMLLIDEYSFKLIIKRLTFHHFMFHHFNHNIIMCVYVQSERVVAFVSRLFARRVDT